ncbi:MULTISPECIES: hypothetical protein [unclassified Anabaena]|uniref:hypothetical protein n=1 Tax=unclassified Anabaena TaxID=2619674 RepID=UPI000B212D1D|nr:MULTISPECIES: hypothetical protein [unclassified Anabaena]
MQHLYIENRFQPKKVFPFSCGFRRGLGRGRKEETWGSIKILFKHIIKAIAYSSYLGDRQ